jgi:uncharacterized protein (DUF302 family)
MPATGPEVSPRSVTETVSRLTGLLAAKGVKVFAVIDQAAPLVALDLPLKVPIWDDAEQTKVTYYGPAALAARYDLNADLTAKLAVIDPLTDALVAP